MDRLFRALNKELPRFDDSGSHRVTLRTSDRGEKIKTFASLGGNLRLFFSIGLPQAEWEERLGAAKRPFVIAGLLSGILGLTLAGGLLVLRKAMRREMKLARMKTEFVANVSHELKTPLSLIKLCSETLQFDRVSGEEKRQEY